METVACSETRILVLGGTGLVGSNFLKTIQESSFITEIYTISRRKLPFFGSLTKLTSVVEPDPDRWVESMENMEPFDIVFTGIGTTKGNGANGFKNQRAIDHDLNLKLAKGAKAKGAKVFMLVSSFNNPYLTMAFPYFALKKRTEDEIIKLGFERTIILRPGPLVGDRSILKSNQSFASTLSSITARLTYNTPCSSLFGFSVQAKEVAEAAVFLLETNRHLDKVKYATSYEMFDLAHALETI